MPILVIILSLPVLLGIFAAPAHATNYGDACNQGSFNGGLVFKWCLAVESRYDSSGTQQVRYRAHVYCYWSGSLTACNFANKGAALRFCSTQPPCQPFDGDYGRGDFDGVLNQTDHVYVGGWHAAIWTSWQADTNQFYARFLINNQLVGPFGGCSQTTMVYSPLAHLVQSCA